MDDSCQRSVSQLPPSQTGEQSPPQPPADEWTVERIIAELDREHDGSLPESAIRAAQQRRDEIIPHLIKLVERATALASDGEFPPGDGHLIAVFLLTEFRAKEALPAIVAAISLSDDDVDELYGDAITEDFCRVFAVLANDSPEQVDKLIANRSLYEFVRWEAAHSYLLWVRDGRLTREQAVEKLRQHLREAIANEDTELASALMYELEQYVPHEAQEEINEAFRQDIVDESTISMHDIENTLARGDARWQEALSDCPPTGVQDTVEELRGWAWFNADGGDDYDEDDEYDDEYAQGFRDMLAPPPSLLDSSLLDDDEFRDVWNDAKSRERPPTHPETVRRTDPHVGRNDPCLCGSGKKFKKCCGAR